MSEEDVFESVPETAVTPAQEPAPASEAAQKEVETAEVEQKPTAGGETPATPAEKEPMIPKSRLDEVSTKNKQLEAKVQELSKIADRLNRIGSRFGKKSDEYLDELDKFYAKQDQLTRFKERGIQPGSVEAELDDLKAWRAKQEEEAAMRPHVQQIEREFNEVKANPKFAVFTKNWEKWQRVFAASMGAEPYPTASEVAQEHLDLLDSEKTAYIKTKTDEGKRVIEGAGGSGPVSKTRKEPARIKDWDQVVQEGARLYAGS